MRPDDGSKICGVLRVYEMDGCAKRKLLCEGAEAFPFLIHSKASER